MHTLLQNDLGTDITHFPSQLAQKRGQVQWVNFLWNLELLVRLRHLVFAYYTNRYDKK